MTEAGELLGYCCFGEPARVPGAEPEPGALDVGYGLAPDRMGGGHGHRFVAAILEWNERSRRTAARHGFVAASRLEDEAGTFLVMVRSASFCRQP